MVFDLQRLARERPGRSWHEPARRDMWRFGSLLALDPLDPGDREHIVSLGEGGTPLLEYPGHRLAARERFRLQIKEEGRAVPGFGANPTQSFKDRGMAMVVSLAKRLGIRRLAIPTQGNAGDSLAEYALAAGLEAVIVMPEDTPMPILGRVAALSRLHPGIELSLVQGTIREAGQRVKTNYATRGFFNVATFQEPGWRIEGKKTLGLELAEKTGGEWQVPDVIVYPTGGGTGILGMWKAFEELETLGVIDSRRPRMIAVQSEVTAPLVQAFEAGDRDTTAADPGQTIATGLNVPGGVGHFRVLQILRQSAGAAVAVSESAITSSLSEVYHDTGWWVGPEGAATLAALEQLIERGLIQTGDRVVAVNTCSFEKYLPNLRHLLGVTPD